MLTQQLHVQNLLIPLLGGELALLITLLQEVAHDVDLHRLHAGVRTDLVVQLPGTAIVVRGERPQQRRVNPFW